MKLEIPKGKYVLAVSGGVDSMVLLDLLAKKPEVKLIVTHFNHNIRDDSVKDELLVQKTAAKYGLEFRTGSANLGKNAPEEAARSARYAFLRAIQNEYGANSIITAHHQDDVIETAFINVIRGTGRLGMSAIINNPDVIRPLLKIPKADLIQYARANNLSWREDVTNLNIDYLRNYLRLRILPEMDSGQRADLVDIIEKVAKTNIKIDTEIAKISHKLSETIERDSFSRLPLDINNEVLAYRLRKDKDLNFDSKTINRLTIAIKTSKPYSLHNVKKQLVLKVTPDTAYFVTP